MSENKLKELRSSLNATTGSGGVDPAFGAPEINAKINSLLVDASPKFSELRNMIPREDMGGQPTFIWNVRTSDNTSTRWAYTYSEGTVASNTNSGTPAQGAKVQLVAVAKTFRTDWEVENYFKVAASSYYDAVADEIQNALAKHVDEEERQIVGGTDTGAYGDAAGFLGLKQLITSYVTLSDTTAVYGITRASGKTYLDAQVVAAGGDSLTLADLDSAITAQAKVGGRPGMFVVSYETADKINALLQAQQRFSGSMNIAGGFVVSTYQGIPIVKSRYMDKAGSSDGNTRLFLVAADNIVMKVMIPTQNVDADLGRVDAVGGFIKSGEVLVVKDLTKNVVVDNFA